jgi:Raf kinase inhibitor-like YbhB/YbcL family protein
LLLSSPAFSHGGLIPAAYTCDASSLSPPLVWSDIPEDAKCLALFCYDPDAPGRTFCHWAIYNIGSGASGLEEGAGARTRKATYPQAVSDFCCAGYDGPCPPSGHGIHHYHFRLSALKEPLDDVATRARCARRSDAAGASSRDCVSRTHRELRTLLAATSDMCVLASIHLKI